MNLSLSCNSFLKLSVPALITCWVVVASTGLFAQAQGAAGPAAGEGTAGETEYLSMEIAPEFIAPTLEGIARNDREGRQRTQAEIRTVRSRINNARRSISDWATGKGGSVNSATVNSWFNGYVIPRMASTDEDLLSQLGNARKGLFQSYISRATNTAARNQIIGLIVPRMREITEGNYHPACRINAMIVLSEINVREGDRSGGGRLPEPDPNLLTFLRSAVTQDQLPDYLKIPALSGIRRHAAARVPGGGNEFNEAEASALIQEMSDILDLRTETSDITPDQIYWMQRLAVQTLGYLGRPGDGGKVATNLRNIIANKDQKILLRIDAVRSYGQLDFSNARELANVKDVTLEIGDLIAASALAEADYIEEKLRNIDITRNFLDGGKRTEQKKTRRGDLGLGDGNLSDGPGSGNQSKGSAEDAPEVLPAYHRDLVQRRLKNVVFAGRQTLTGENRGGSRRSSNGQSEILAMKDYVDQGSEESQLIDQLASDIQSLLTKTDIKDPALEEEKKKKKDDDDDDKEVEEVREPRTKSLADELKDELRAGAGRIKQTLAKFNPKVDESTEADTNASQIGAGQ